MAPNAGAYPGGVALGALPPPVTKGVPKKGRERRETKEKRGKERRGAKKKDRKVNNAPNRPNFL